MKKSTLVLFAFVAFLFISVAFTARPPGVRYKNLKVLSKKTTKEEMDSIMKSFTASLGVKCGMCHVRGNDAQRNWDFASDSNKHKDIARGMMSMTARINKKYFKEVNKEKSIAIVTCYTCHNGKEEPGSKPPVHKGPPGGPGGQGRPGALPAGSATSTPPTQATPPKQ